jgi:hypothetical protein
MALQRLADLGSVREGRKMFQNKKLYLLSILLIISLACAVPTFTAPQQRIINTETSQPSFTETFLPTSIPTFTFTPTLIRATAKPVTETFTPNPSVTFENMTATISTDTFSTLTIESVSIEVSKPTNCRVGPGKAYEIAGTLLVGETALVLGRDPSNQYWYIPNPDPGIEYCWVWGEYASFAGANLALPVFTPLPTPTSTPTALPDIAFDIKGLKSDKCGDDFWIEVQITNTSENKLVFRSFRIEVEDTDTGTFKFNSADGFINRNGCGTYFQTETLEYEKSYILSGPVFPYNFNGNTLRVFTTICTEKDLKGICRTIKIAIKP